MQRQGLQIWRKTVAVWLALLMAPVPGAAQSPYTLRATTEIVLVNVTVRDKNGQLVHDLKKEDFTILEDGRSQTTLSFDIENTDAVVSSETGVAPLLKAPRNASAPPPAAAAANPALKDRRLIILFFDLSSMQPDEADRAANAALHYVDKQMSPADLVAVASLSSSLKIDQEFTSDREQLRRVLQGFSITGGQGFEEGTTGSTEGTPDTGGTFTADDTEYNIFNTDRRLQAIRSLASALARVDQKKSLLYFSSGMDRTGIENQSQLRAAINAAVRSNLAIYTVDIRGLQAMVPGGDATQASLRGTSVYSGRASLNQYDSNFATQETLATLAGDTGGKAFLDSNDFAPAFTRVQSDTASYYMLGYHSTNPARDGRYRKITVRINRPDVKLEYRKGYYAPADFQHSTHNDREQQLDEQLASDLPSTDFPVYMSAGYFRVGENRFFVPVSVVVPGSEIPFTRASDQDRATLDVIGIAEDDRKRPFATVRDTVKVNVSTSQEVRRKNVQYNGAFVLPPGTFHLKFVIRENQTGRMGSFETDLTIPEFKNLPLKMSSVILSSQKQPAKGRKENPLVRDGSELIPNVAHVFSSGQHLYFYYEVYDPGRASNAPSGPAATPTPNASAPNAPAAAGKGSAPGTKNKGAIRVLTNVAFFAGTSKAYETSLVEAHEITVPDRKAAAFELDVPLDQLRPGFYTCQVNVIDDAAGHFTFPRLALLVRH